MSLDEGPMLKTLDYTIRIGSTTTIYISISISTLPTQHTTFKTTMVVVAPASTIMGFSVVC